MFVTVGPTMESTIVMKKLKVTLAWQILVALVLGILLGAVLHNQGELRDWMIANILSPAGDIFIRMIKMIVVPIVVAMLVVGIAGIGDAKKLGSIGCKTILYFEIIMTLAIILGMTLANVFHPGHGIKMSTLTVVDISKYEQTTVAVQSGGHSVVGTILSLIPANIFASMAKGDMLPFIFFSVLFSLGLASLQENTRAPLLNVFNTVAETMFKVTHYGDALCAGRGICANFGHCGDLWFRLAAAFSQADAAGVWRHYLFCAGGTGLRGAALPIAYLDIALHIEGRADFGLFHRQFGKRLAAYYRKNGGLRRAGGHYRLRVPIGY